MWIKICGICNLESARIVVDAQPDAIGLNFYESSPRHVPQETAKQILQLLPETILPVGLFVNHEKDDILHTVETLGLSTIQLHGDESPDFLHDLQKQKPELQLMKAFRLGENGWQNLENYLEECQQLGISLFACLLDAYSSDAYGGTGKKIAWSEIPEHYRHDDWPPLILAGGLTSENVADAISKSHPWGVDVAGGVESSPGIKEKLTVQRFLDAANAKNPATED